MIVKQVMMALQSDTLVKKRATLKTMPRLPMAISDIEISVRPCGSREFNASRRVIVEAC